MPSERRFFDIVWYLEPGATLNVFRLGYHHHFPEEMSNCNFISGFILTVFNINIGIGVFRE